MAIPPNTIQLKLWRAAWPSIDTLRSGGHKRYANTKALQIDPRTPAIVPNIKETSTRTATNATGTNSLCGRPAKA